MKKIIMVLCLVLCIDIVNAKDNSELVSIIDKCVIVNDNSVSIPVTVKSVNNGSLSKLIDVYTLGSIDNDDTYNITINNIKSDSIKSVIINNGMDENKKSNIYFIIDKDIDLESASKLVTFDININFNSNIPNKMYVLGNEIAIADQSTCQSINENRVYTVQNKVLIKKEENSNTIFYLIIILLLIIVILEFVFLLKYKILKK